MGANHWTCSIWLCSLRWGEAWSKVPGLTFPHASLCIRIRQSRWGCIKLVTTQSQYWTATVHQEKAQKCSLLHVKLFRLQALWKIKQQIRANGTLLINHELNFCQELKWRKKHVQIACGYVYEGCDK